MKTILTMLILVAAACVASAQTTTNNISGTPGKVFDLGTPTNQFNAIYSTNGNFQTLKVNGVDVVTNPVAGSSTNGLATTNWANATFYPTSNPSAFVTEAQVYGQVQSYAATGQVLIASSAPVATALANTNLLNDLTTGQTLTWNGTLYSVGSGPSLKTVRFDGSVWRYTDAGNPVAATNWSGNATGFYAQYNNGIASQTIVYAGGGAAAEAAHATNSDWSTVAATATNAPDGNMIASLNQVTNISQSISGGSVTNVTADAVGNSTGHEYAATNSLNLFTGTFYGDGSGLTNLTPALDRRPFHVERIEWGLLPSGTMSNIDLINIGPGTNGTVTFMQCSFQTLNGAQPQNSTMDSTICIKQNGSTTGERSSNGSFWRNYGAPTPFYSTPLGLTMAIWSPQQQWASYRAVEIPFTNGIQITITNGSAITSNLVWSQVYWREGTDPKLLAGESRRVYHEYWTGFTNIAQYNFIELLPQISGKGEIESVCMLVNPSSSTFTYMEGNPQIIVDGVTNTWGGTEDFFGGNFYWNSGANQFVNDRFGVKMGSTGLPGTGSAYSMLAWRNFYPIDRIPFNSSLRIIWENGQSGQAGAPGTVQICSLVSYWTAQ